MRKLGKLAGKTLKALEELDKNMKIQREEAKTYEEAFEKKNKLYEKFRSATDGYTPTFDEAEDFVCRILAEVILKESVVLDTEEDEVVEKIIHKMVEATNEYRKHYLYPLVIAKMIREKANHGRI